MLDPTTMSPLEQDFIRVYVAAMRRNYDLIKSVLHLMDPAQAGITSVVDAALAAQQLREMQAEFDSTLHALQGTHNFRTRMFPPTPTFDDIADLFSLSFFKIVKTSMPGQPKKDAGWFSGEPAAWGETIKSVLAIKHSAIPKVLSAYIDVLKKLLLNDTMPDIEKDHTSGPPPNIANKFAEYFLQATDTQYEDADWIEDDDGFLDELNDHDE